MKRNNVILEEIIGFDGKKKYFFSENSIDLLTFELTNKGYSIIKIPDKQIEELKKLDYSLKEFFKKILILKFNINKKKIII